MTQEEVRNKIYSYAKVQNIIFDDNDIAPEISCIITNDKYTEAKQKDLLKLLHSLFSRIKNGRGTSANDDRDGKIVCEKVRSEIKKYMAISFETQSKGLSKQYNVYKFELAPR